MDQYLEQDKDMPEVSSGGCSPRSRTILWCVPRSGSTALTKCLSAIDGIETSFEPYCYCYAADVEYKLATGTDIPTVYEGNEEAYALAKQQLDIITRANCVPERLAYTTVQHQLENASSKHVFVKDMAVSIVEATRQFLPRGYKHTFLIRNPRKYIYSWRKSIFGVLSKACALQGAAADESTFDLDRDDRYWTSGCYMKEIYDLWKYVKENVDSDPVVIDTEDLLTKPKETLSRYCALVGLPYHDRLLQWEGSVEGFQNMTTCTESSDNLLKNLTYFYGTAIKSSYFYPPSELPPNDQITPDVIRCSEKIMEYYNEIYDTRLKV